MNHPKRNTFKLLTLALALGAVSLPAFASANGARNIAGFRNAQGVLTPLAGSSRPLSAAGGTGSAQVGFSPDGDVLLVTEKGTNKRSSYRVRDDGTTDAPVVTASSGVTPFGFAFDRRGHALVWCCMLDGTNKTDGFLLKARRKPEQ